MNKYASLFNIYGDDRFAKATKKKSVAKGILMQDENILLLYASRYDIYYVPGGELHNVESEDEALIRAVEEKTSFRCLCKKQLFRINEYYEEWEISNTYFSLEEEDEYGCMNLTRDEEKMGLQYKWVPFKDAVKIFSHYNEFRYYDEEKRKNYEREYKALTLFKDIK